MRYFIYTVIILLSVMVSCAYGLDEQVPNSIETSIGEEFVIVLDGNATTGYEWQLAAPVDEKLIKFVSSKYVPDNAGLVGSPGKSYWTFKAAWSGHTKIDFKYVRPWEKNVEPIKKITYSIQINKMAKAPGIPKPSDSLVPYSEAYNSDATGDVRADEDEDY